MSTEVGERFKGFSRESGEEEGAHVEGADVKIAEGGEGWGQ